MSLNYYFGGLEPTIYRFGGAYHAISMGEWWRVITASGFHTGVPHWLANLALILLVGPLYKSTTNSNGIFVFIIGCTAGALSTYVSYRLGYTETQGYAGTSAGIFALLGYVFLYTYKNKQLKTGKLYITIANFLLMSVMISPIVAPPVSNLAHISSFIFGTFLAKIYPHSSFA